MADRECCKKEMFVSITCIGASTEVVNFAEATRRSRSLEVEKVQIVTEDPDSGEQHTHSFLALNGNRKQHLLEELERRGVIWG